ncbi:hypothetical protein EP342_00765 [bacterium]|nr:MAG: hypothetical protein EP342_00765 [bacterium]
MILYFAIIFIFFGGRRVQKVDKSSNNIINSKNQISTFFRNWLNLNRWVVVLYLIIMATAAVLYVGNVNDTTQLLKEIRALEHKIEDLENKRKIIDSKVKGLQSPERIIQIGTDKLNMKLSDEAPLFIEDNETENK